MTEVQAKQLEKDVKTYVKTAVEIDFKKYDLRKINWKEAGNTVENIFIDAYSLLEAAG